MDSWRAMIAAQGGDPDAPLPVARETHTIVADRDGILVDQPALPYGIAAWRLGAGRARKEDPVDHAAGIDLHVKIGEPVRAGQPLLTMHANDAARFDRAIEALNGAWTIGREGDAVNDGGPLVAERIA